MSFGLETRCVIILVASEMSSFAFSACKIGSNVHNFGFSLIIDSCVMFYTIGASLGWKNILWFHQLFVSYMILLLHF